MEPQDDRTKIPLDQQRFHWEIQKEDRAYELEKEKMEIDRWRVDVLQRHEQAQLAYKAAADYAQSALKILFALNAGGTAALPALRQALTTPPPIGMLAWPLIAFVAGLALTMLAYLSAYLCIRAGEAGIWADITLRGANYHLRRVGESTIRTQEQQRVFQQLVAEYSDAKSKATEKAQRHSKWFNIFWRTSLVLSLTAFAAFLYGAYQATSVMLQ